MIGHILVDTITKVNYSRNEGGDFVYSTQETLNCRFREINDLTRANGREEFSCDALVHFAPDTVVKLGDIFEYGDDHYRVSDITKARALGGSDIKFIKCGLIRHRQVS